MSTGLVTTNQNPSRRGMGRSSPREAVARLSPVDRQVISALSAQRVLTASQLEHLFASIPSRTLRYRTARLTRLGLVGRTRPYRERGSAPFHYWPSRTGDAYARGAPAPRGGERDGPNPFFLAHAAGLSELYVGLADGEARGLDLRAFRREGEAREPFTVVGAPRAIAPDARLHLCDAEGGDLLAHVELDRGTMSHARLKSKADGYVAYAAEAAWTRLHPFCPCLLFLTTTETRARTFMKTLAGSLRRSTRGGHHLSWFTAAACAVADEPGRALAEPCWHDLTGRGALTLLDCLKAARAPWDAARSRDRAARRASEQRLNQLRSDPDELRGHLREKLFCLTSWLERLGRDGHIAFVLLIEASAPLCEIEREALAAFASYVGDELLSFDGRAAAAPAVEQQEQVERLVGLYRAKQETLLGAFLDQVGPLPILREARDTLSSDALLDHRALQTLSWRVKQESECRSAQEERRRAYVSYRDYVARHEAGIFGRLRGMTTVLAERIDQQVLRYCGKCGEMIYPETAGGKPAENCAFCNVWGLLTLKDATKTYPERFHW
jgi:hypothetical protein